MISNIENDQIFQFDQMGPHQVLPLEVQVTGSNGNEEVLHIPQSFRTGASPSNDFVSYPEHLLEERSYPSAEMQLVYSMVPADWAYEKLRKLYIIA